MRIKKYYLLFLALILFLNCFADSSEEIIMPIEGLQIVTLGNVQNPQNHKNKFETYISSYSISMDNYNGFGFDFSFEKKNLFSILYSFDYLENQIVGDLVISKYSGDLVISKYSIEIAKNFTFGRYFYFGVAHAFNYMSQRYHYEYTDIWGRSDEYESTDEIFEPSLKLYYGISLNVIRGLNVYYNIENYNWYTDPELFSIKVNEIYDKPQGKIGISYKF